MMRRWNDDDDDDDDNNNGDHDDKDSYHPTTHHRRDHHGDSFEDQHDDGEFSDQDIDETTAAAAAAAVSSSTGGYYESFTLSSPPSTSRSHPNHSISPSPSVTVTGGGGVGLIGGTSLMSDLHHRAVTSRNHHHHNVPVTPHNNNNNYDSDADDESPRHKLQRQLPSLGGASISSSTGANRFWFWAQSQTSPSTAQRKQQKKKRVSDNYTGPSSSASSPHHSPTTSVSNWPFHHHTYGRTYRWIRTLVASGVFMYVVTLYQSTYHLAGDQRLHNEDSGGRPFDYYWKNSGGGGSSDTATIRTNNHDGKSSLSHRSTPSDIFRRPRHLFDPQWKRQRSNQLQDLVKKTSSSTTDRRQRSLPPPEFGSSNPPLHDQSSYSMWYQYVHLDHEGRRWRDAIQAHVTGRPPANVTQHKVSFDEDRGMTTSTHLDDALEEEVATVDQLCGFTAQNASLSRPSAYPSSAALNSKSRVIITGILNPVGLNLALHLHHICGVQVITGVDTMFPNTVMNRLLLQERLQLLQTNIPNFVRPAILPFIGLDPKGSGGKDSNNGGDHDKDNDNNDEESDTGVGGGGSSSSHSSKNIMDEQLKYFNDFAPTHIVHLASYSLDVYSTAMMDPRWQNTHSPYVSPTSTSINKNNDDTSDGDGTRSDTTTSQGLHDLDNFFYPIRSSIVSMQQLLQSLLSSSTSQLPAGPQFIYATTQVPRGDENHNPLQTTLKLMDEILVDSYSHYSDAKQPLFRAIGLRFPNTVFGPWGQAGSTVHDLMQRAVEHWNLTYTTVIGEGANVTTINTGSRVQGSILPSHLTTAGPALPKILDLLHVDDAVDSIVAAMQYHSRESITISVPAARSLSVLSVASAIESYLESSTHSSSSANRAVVTGVELVEKQLGRYDSEILPARRITMHEGLVKSLAWHIDRLSPYGPPKVETGDVFLQRHGVDTCHSYDLTCHKTLTYMPCSSECNIHDKCLPSVFDHVTDLVWNVSDGCDIVLYTQSLGYDVDDMDLHAEYMDDKDLGDDELLVCNFAFIPRESKLVSMVSNKVPNEQLAKFGIKPQQGDVNSQAMRERKLDGLNGRLLYRGWILVWVKDGIEPLSTSDMSILKLSPGRFFHPGVQYALFVEENFSVSPNLDDVLFLVDEMKRQRLPQRTLKKEEKVKTPHGTVTKKVKLRLPAEPPRRAAILFAPLRFPNIDDPSIKKYGSGNRKLSTYDAAKFMRYEVGYQYREKESASNRRQREYYERIPSYINKNTELRSSYEPWYRYSMRHWVRTRWVLHDFHLEEARQLRCDWYQEHLQWGNDLDQLSFANVMAIRELRRRISHNEPDDHIKSFIEEHPEFHDVTDSYEWHELEHEVNKLHQERTSWKSHRQETVEQNRGALPPDQDDDDSENGAIALYVRIMSERVMATSRKLWSKMKKKTAKAKKAAETESSNR